MRRGWRATGLGAAMVGLAVTAGCGSSSGTGGQGTGGTSAASSSRASSTTAASVSPSPAVGTYGAPANPSATDPTVIAHDPPVSRAPEAGASVFVTDAIWNSGTKSVEIGSFVQGVVESGGTCTVTMTKDGKTASASGAAEEGATTTWCGVIAVPASQLSSGRWSAVVTYKSASTHGSSDPKQVTVP
jgi:hypothetical protein